MNLFFKKSLKTLFFNHQGKVADKWLSYLDVYDEEFHKYRTTPYPILEIGVNNGGSLEIWSKYFYKSQNIIGVDILNELKKLSFKDKRVSVFISDSNNLHLEYLNNFDAPVIIIDDGSHVSSDIIKTFINMFEILRYGGIYLIEDLCCSYWKNFNKKGTSSSMGFFKLLADIVNFEHWKNNDGEKTLQRYLKKLNVNNSQKLIEYLSCIKSIKFYNSVCIVEKYNPNHSNQIGERVVVGNDAITGKMAKNKDSINNLNISYREFELDDSDLLIK